MSQEAILMKHKKLYMGLAIGTLATGLLINQAEAVPSFARQTGLACAACHTVFPELNAFGRSFKLNGYTLTGITQVQAKESSTESGLKFNQIPPLSAMLQVTATNTKANNPQTDIGFPDQLSFFFAGEISPHMGSFIQITMAPADGPGFAMDNTDIRYANHAGNVTYGITLNNNPTVQDLWNSTPAWGFPFTAGAGTTATPLIADGLGGAVAGLGAYADWGNGIYTELDLYRDTGAFDGPNTAGVRISGAAPYYRLAWNNTFSNGDYLMVGVYGMQTKLVDAATYAGPENKYNDNAVDLQYEHPFANNNMLSVHASYTNEKQTLDLAGGGTPTLKSLNLNAIYHWGYRATATLGYLNNTGNNGAFDDTAYTLQYSYLPWQNTKFTAQYVSYSKVAGQTSGASDNNTLALQAWLMW
jgi:iron:rusticyanin reductase